MVLMVGVRVRSVASRRSGASTGATSARSLNARRGHVLQRLLCRCVEAISEAAPRVNVNMSRPRPE